MILSRPQPNVIFSLVLQLKKSVQEHTLMLILFQIIYLAELATIFIVILNPTEPMVMSTLDSVGLILGLSLITIVVVVEVIVALFWRVHMQLYNQLVFFRYSIFPAIAILMAHEIDHPNFLPFWLPYSILTLLAICMFLLCQVFFKDSDQNKIVFSSSQYSKYYVINDCLMVLSLPLGQTVWLKVVLMVWALLSLLINSKILSHPRRSTCDKLTGFIAYFKQFILLLLIANKTIYSQTLQNQMVLISSPIVLIVFLYSFFYQGKETLNPKIFDGDTSLDQFQRFLYIISDEVATVKSNLNINFEDSYLMLFISVHKSVCTNNTCMLHHQSTYDQIGNSNQLSYRKMVIHKIAKKVESLLDLYTEKHTDNINLKLLKMKFYSVHLANKLKIKHILSGIDYRKLNLTNKLSVYILNERANQMSSAEFIDSSKSEDQYEIFKKKMMEMLVALREFWSALSEQKVDINNLILKSYKIFPLKKDIQTAWKKNLAIQKFSSWNIIRTYTLYCRSILHDQTRACVLQDYSQLLQTRLKNKQELGYMKFDAESGVIAISLSEGSLGNIHSANNMAIRLFNYLNQKQMLKLRVNDIMPDVYSIVHDNILGSFLKNRYKSINQDERLLFGKNKNGFIFPLHLQLRKLSWNANDELIFISNINSIKARSAPINCIVDLEGDIRSTSSTFSWLFLKKQKEYVQIVNIQVIIPSFFKVIEENEEDNISKYTFEENCQVKKSASSFDVSFIGSPLFIKGNKVGYLIEGQTVDESKNITNRKNFMSEVLKANQSRLSFNPNSCSYEVDSNEDFNMIKTMKSNSQFTIPYLKSDDIEKMFGGQQVVKSNVEPYVYGKDIRTFRLTNNRIELAMQETSFASEFSDENWKERSVLKRIQRMKEQINVDNSSTTTHSYKVIIVVFSAILMGISGLIFYQGIALRSQYLTTSEGLRSQWKIKALLPQLLIYSYFPASLSNVQKLNSIRTEFYQALTNCPIEQWQKESMIKMVNSAHSQQSISFQTNLFTFVQPSYSIENDSQILLYFNSGLLLLVCIVVWCIFTHFQKTLQQMYSIFLSVTEKKMTQIKLFEQKLFDYLVHFPHNSLENPFGGESKPLEEEDQEEESPIIKKIKKNSQSRDLKDAYKLLVPFVFLFLLTIISSILISVIINQLHSDNQVWLKGEELFPESSSVTMEKLFSFLNMTGNFNTPNQFNSLQQNYERIIFQSSFNTAKLKLFLKGNLCLDPTYFGSLPSSLQLYCQSHPNQDNSLANNFNLLQSILYGTSNETTTQWITLVSIEYELIKPLIQFSMNQFQVYLTSELESIVSALIIFSIVSISIVVITTFYIIRFPLKQMDQKLFAARDLISLVPSEKEKKPILTLATLTTEALQFKDYQRQR